MGDLVSIRSFARNSRLGTRHPVSPRPRAFGLIEMPGALALHPHIIPGSVRAARVARVGHPTGLHEHDAAFPRRNRPVLHALGYDVHFPLASLNW